MPDTTESDIPSTREDKTGDVLG
ncbi:hypothetical protein GMOD_00007185 [Pyrenophora seminiperda CCB06]|uniref:Uncharacterized protein n=1 Tax=Pyrenophora seminiperda CCB06 TaxID=1302712 RepID=A0A3M7MCQ0_9PLEO|nr:hypothetical protein GMOD_00007185 [Pyrenophora seminiperda CCB06]